MIGNSWAGFNSLQVAALRPPELGAIVTSCSTDDRYADDMHYMGGCLLTDSLDWGTMFQGLLAPAAGSGAGRRGVAGDLGARLGGDLRADRGVVAPPAPRCVLAPRLGLRGLRRDRGSGPGRRRLAGRLFERDPAAAGRSDGAASRGHRSVGARLSTPRGARTRLRLPRPGRALVRSLAQGREQRRDGWPDAAGVDG